MLGRVRRHANLLARAVARIAYVEIAARLAVPAADGDWARLAQVAAKLHRAAAAAAYAAARGLAAHATRAVGEQRRHLFGKQCALILPRRRAWAAAVRGGAGGERVRGALAARSR